MNNDKKAVVDKIRKFIFGDMPPAQASATVEAATTDYKLQDGTAVSIDNLAVGGILTIAGAVAPDGAYTLEDGTTLTVAAGVISAVTPVEPTDTLPEDMNTPQKMQAVLNKFVDSTTPDIKKMAVILKAVFEYNFGWQLREAAEKATRDVAIATYQSGFSKVEKEVANQKEANKLLLELLEGFLNESEVKPTDKVVDLADWDNMTPIQRRRAERALAEQA